MTGDRAPVGPLRVRPTVGSTFLVIAAIATSIVLVNVFVAARRTIGWVFATAIVAWLLTAVIALCDRWMPRAAAVVVTLIGFVAIGAGTWVGLGASVRAEVNRARIALPVAAERLERRSGTAREFRLADRVRGFVDDLDRRFGARAAVSKAAGTAPVYVVTGVLLLFFLGYGPRYGAAALAQIPDEERRQLVKEMAASGSQRARRYLLITAAQVAAVATVCTVAFHIAGLPAPFALGLLVGAFGAIPYLGIVLGGLPAVLLAAAENDRSVLLAVLAVVAVLQVVEALVVRRRVDPRTLRVGPAAMLVAGIVGFRLYGLGGAVYAAAAIVLVVALLDEWSARERVVMRDPG